MKERHHFQLSLVKTELLDFPANQPIQYNSAIKIDTLSLGPTKAIWILEVLIDLLIMQPQSRGCATLLPLDCVPYMIVTWRNQLNKHSNVDYSHTLFLD